jgi:hypothetical protein
VVSVDVSDANLSVTIATVNGTLQDGKEVAVMDQPKTLTVPEAGRVYFDLGRNASYEAARRGDIPTIKIGRLLRVPVVALERMLEETRRNGNAYVHQNRS